MTKRPSSGSRLADDGGDKRFFVWLLSINHFLTNAELRIYLTQSTTATLSFPHVTSEGHTPTAEWRIHRQPTPVRTCNHAVQLLIFIIQRGGGEPRTTRTDVWTNNGERARDAYTRRLTTSNYPTQRVSSSIGPFSLMNSLTVRARTLRSCQLNQINFGFLLSAEVRN